MSDKESSHGLSIGFIGILALVFITLKICGVITWSWWWVLFPLWIGFILAILIFLAAISAVLFLRQKGKRK